MSARHLWFTPIILATWEAEISRIVVPGQPRQKSSWDTTSAGKTAGWVVYTYHPNNGRKHKMRGLWSWQAWQKERPTSKISRLKGW
jgi:hypothetical protein